MYSCVHSIYNRYYSVILRRGKRCAQQRLRMREVWNIYTMRFGKPLRRGHLEVLWIDKIFLLNTECVVSCGGFFLFRIEQSRELLWQWQYYVRFHETWRFYLLVLQLWPPKQEPYKTQPISTCSSLYLGYTSSPLYRIFDRHLIHKSEINTLWTGDADLRLYITIVQDGWRKSAFLTRASFSRTIRLITQYMEHFSEWSRWRIFIRGLEL